MFLHGCFDALYLLRLCKKNIIFKKKICHLSSQVIHGTTGTGRSGIYACVDSQIRRIQKQTDVNVYESVLDVCEHRYEGVKTLDEYIFIHDTLLEWILKRNIEDIDVEYLPHYIENINKKSPDGKKWIGTRGGFKIRRTLV